MRYLSPGAALSRAAPLMLLHVLVASLAEAAIARGTHHADSAADRPTLQPLHPVVNHMRGTTGYGIGDGFDMSTEILRDPVTGVPQSALHITHSADLLLAPNAAAFHQVLGSMPSAASLLQCAGNDTLIIRAAPESHQGLLGAVLGDAAIPQADARRLVGLRSALLAKNIAGCAALPELATVVAVRPGDGATSVVVVEALPHEVHTTASGAPAAFSVVTHRVLSDAEAVAMMDAARPRAESLGADAPRSEPGLADVVGEGHAAHDAVASSFASRTVSGAGEVLTLLYPTTVSGNGLAPLSVQTTCHGNDGTPSDEFFVQYEIDGVVYKQSPSPSFWVSQETGKMTLRMPTSLITQNVTFEFVALGCQKGSFYNSRLAVTSGNVLLTANIDVELGETPRFYRGNKPMELPLTWQGCGSSQPTITMWQDGLIKVSNVFNFTDFKFNTKYTAVTLTMMASLVPLDDLYIMVTGVCAGKLFSIKTEPFVLVPSGSPAAFTAPTQYATLSFGHTINATWESDVELQPGALVSLDLFSTCGPSYKPARVNGYLLTALEFESGNFSFAVTPTAAMYPTSTCSGYFQLTYTASGKSDASSAHGLPIVLLGRSEKGAEIVAPVGHGVFPRTGKVPVSVRWSAGSSADAHAKLQLFQYNWGIGSTFVGEIDFDMHLQNPSVTVDLSQFPGMSTVGVNPAFQFKITGFDCASLGFGKWCETVESAPFYLPFDASATPVDSPTFNFTCAECGGGSHSAISLCGACRVGKHLGVATDLGAGIQTQMVSGSLSFSRYWWSASITTLSSQYTLEVSADVPGSIVVTLDVLLMAAVELPVIPVTLWGFNPNPQFDFFGYKIELACDVSLLPSLSANMSMVGRAHAIVPVNRRVDVSVSNVGDQNTGVGVTLLLPGASWKPKLTAAGRVDVMLSLGLGVRVRASMGTASRKWLEGSAAATAVVRSQMTAHFPPLAPRVPKKALIDDPALVAGCSKPHMIDVTATALVVNIGGTVTFPVPSFAGIKTTTMDFSNPDVPVAVLLEGCVLPQPTTSLNIPPAQVIPVPRDIAESFVAIAYLTDSVAERLGFEPAEISLVVPSAVPPTALSDSEPEHAGQMLELAQGNNNVMCQMYVTQQLPSGTVVNAYPANGNTTLSGFEVAIPGTNTTILVEPAIPTPVPPTPVPTTPGPSTHAPPGPRTPAPPTPAPHTRAPSTPAPPTPSHTSTTRSPPTPSHTSTTRSPPTTKAPVHHTSAAQFRVAGSVTLSGDFAQALKDDRDALEAAVREDLADALGVPRENMTVTQLRLGSLIVDFIAGHGHDTDAEADAVVSRVDALPNTTRAHLDHVFANTLQVFVRAGGVKAKFGVDRAAAVVQSMSSATPWTTLLLWWCSLVVASVALVSA